MNYKYIKYIKIILNFVGQFSFLEVSHGTRIKWQQYGIRLL